MELWTAFIMGLVGSLHCVGMCGPIALALPYQANSKWQSAFNVVLYNLGRILTYSFFGLLLGFLGKGIALSGYQQWVSIFLGCLLLITAVFSLPVESKLQNIGSVRWLMSQVQKSLGALLQKPDGGSLLLIGILNGFLPCGFVYVGLAGAVTTGSILKSMGYMALFGLGTVPLMLSVSLSSRFISLPTRRKIQKILPVFLFLFAILFILRGLNLGIPFISPQIGEGGGSCH